MEEEMPRLEPQTPNDLEDRPLPTKAALDKQKEKKVVVDTSGMPENTPVKFGVMGSEEIPIDKDEESLFFTSLRIGKIQGLEGCLNCKVLNFRNNLIEYIEGLQDLAGLEELELYDNRIKQIENIAHMTQLRYARLTQRPGPLLQQHQAHRRHRLARAARRHLLRLQQNQEGAAGSPR